MIAENYKLIYEKENRLLRQAVSLLVETDGLVLPKIAKRFGVEFDFGFEFAQHPAIFRSKVTECIVERRWCRRDIKILTLLVIATLYHPRIIATEARELDETPNSFLLFRKPDNDRPFPDEIMSVRDWGRENCFGPFGSCLKNHASYFGVLLRTPGLPFRAATFN